MAVSSSAKKIMAHDMRDGELNEKLHKYSEMLSVQKVTVTTHVIHKKRSKFGGILGWVIIGSHFMALCFFCLLFCFSYIPQTKNIVAAVLP